MGPVETREPVPLSSWLHLSDLIQMEKFLRDVVKYSICEANKRKWKIMNSMEAELPIRRLRQGLIMN